MRVYNWVSKGDFGKQLASSSHSHSVLWFPTKELLYDSGNPQMA